MTRHMFGFCAALAVAMASPGASQAAELFDVRGVAANDALNMRELEAEAATSHNAPIIRAIPHDARNIEATGLILKFGPSTWRQVKFDGDTGWVNARYLRRSDEPFTLSLSDRLHCAGTEPFWGLEIEGRQAWLSSPDMGPQSRQGLNVTSRLRGVGRPGLWSIDAAAADGSTTLGIIVNHSGQCSDGMSDYLYSMEAFVTGLFAGKGPAQGCCTFR